MVKHSLWVLIEAKYVMYGYYSQGICKNVIKQREKWSDACVCLHCVFMFIMSAEGWCYNC